MSSSFKQKQLLIGSLFATNFILIGSLHAADTHLSLKCGAGQNPNGTINAGASPVGVNKSLLASVNHADGWKLLSDSLTINNDHTHCHFDFSARNNTLPVEGVFFDSAAFNLEIIKTGSEALTEPGFEGTQLVSYISQDPQHKTDKWRAEDANIIGATGGVQPRSGSSMLKLNKTGGGASQVRQVLDLSQTNTTNATVKASYWVNSTNNAAGIPAFIAVYKGDSPTPGGSCTNLQGTAVSVPVVANTWTKVEQTIVLGSSKCIAFELRARNSDLTADGLFIDDATLKIEATTTTANLLADSNFEPPLSGFEAFYRTPGNVATGWKAEEWNAERAFLENAISSLIPHSGDVMVQACDDGLIVSQISQIIQLPALDPGSTVIAHYSVNTAVPEPGDDSVLCSGRTPGNGIPGPGDHGAMQIPMIPLAGLLILSLGITFGAYKARSKKAK